MRWFFLQFRKHTIESFAIVFNGSENQTTNEKLDGNFADKWGWFGVMYRLTDGKITNLGKVAKLELLECLTWLSYETDLQEQNNLQLNGQ